MSSRRRKATAHSTREAADARLRCRRERVKANASGCGELELAQGVVGALADLASYRQPRHGRVAPLPNPPVEREVGRGRAVRVHGGFDERPAQVHRAGLGELAAPACLSPSTVSSRRLADGQPSWARNACRRNAQRRPSPASAFRNRVRSRSRWISASGTHDSGSISFASKRASQRESRRSVFAPRHLPSKARLCPGSASRTPKPRPASLRQAQSQPIVASIATAWTRSRHRSTQRARRSRPAEKRSSTTPPPSGSSIAASNTCSWMSIAAYTTSDLLS
jgi:hypothetical protein